jgi:hypothetical protein
MLIGLGICNPIPRLQSLLLIQMQLQRRCMQKVLWKTFFPTPSEASFSVNLH